MTHSQIKLFLISFLHQLFWFAPAMILCYFVSIRLHAWCDSYFEIPEIQKSVLAITHQSAQTPTAFSLFDSFSDFMIKTTANAKLYMLSTVSNLIANLGHLLLDILILALCWKFISKLRYAYHRKSHDSDITQALISKLQPEIKALRQEVAHLATLIQQKGK